MSTRTNFAYGPADNYTIFAYKHHDGYPSGQYWLIGVETLAQYINKVMAEGGVEEDYDEHGDIEYLYRFDDGRVWVRPVPDREQAWLSLPTAIEIESSKPCPTCGSTEKEWPRVKE